jgi:mycoredoxin
MDESVPRTPSIAKLPVTVQKVSLQKTIEAEIAAGHHAKPRELGETPLRATPDQVRQNGIMSEQKAPSAVDVYWRPGCPFCNRLFRAFEGAGVTTVLHNIWEDDDARAFVQAHNRGNETVPTVAIADLVVTNPDPAAFIDALMQKFPSVIAS